MYRITRVSAVTLFEVHVSWSIDRGRHLWVTNACLLELDRIAQSPDLFHLHFNHITILQKGLGTTERADSCRSSGHNCCTGRDRCAWSREDNSQHDLHSHCQADEYDSYQNHPFLTLTHVAQDLLRREDHIFLELGRLSNLAIHPRYHGERHGISKHGGTD